MLTSIITKTFAGALVGYITNDLAIQMLFRKRLGLGGIFIRTRAEFIENISKIVERDIINHHTLEQELNNPAFDAMLEEAVRYYFETKLFEIAPAELKLGQIPQIQSTVNGLLTGLEGNFANEITPFFQTVVSGLSVSDLVSQKQTDFIGDNLAKMFIDKTTESKAIRKIIQDIYTQYADQPLENLIVTPLWTQISHNISHVIHQQLPDFATSPQVISSLENLFELAEIKKATLPIAQKIADKRITDILGETYSNQLEKEILLRLTTILTSAEGEQIFQSFARVLITALEQEEKTLFELLNEDLAQKIRNFFKDIFPQIFQKIIEWLHSKRKKIEVLVDATFSQSIDSKFKNWLVETFIGSVSRSVDVVGKMSEILETYSKNPEKISKATSEQIINFLNTQSVGSIVRLLKSQNSIVSLSLILQKNIVAAVTDIPPQQSFFHKKIGDYFSAEQIASFLEKTAKKLLVKELPAHIHKDRRTMLLVSGEIANSLDALLLKNVNRFLSAEKSIETSIWAEKYLVQILENNATRIAPFLSNLITTQVTDKKMSGFISAKQLQEFSQNASFAIVNFAQKEFSKREENDVHAYLRLLNRVPDMHTQLAVALKNALMSDLPSLMKGRIEDVVRTNLTNQSPQTIRDMVEKFMGKELKPITILGALWGGLAGMALPFIPTGESFAMQTGVSALMYGATGMGTNWIALKMIFRPYYRKKILGIGIPFTPGVAIKNQGRFAGNMGDFVGNKLLNKEGLQLSIDKNKEKLTSLLNDLFTKNNFEQVDKFVVEHKNALSEKISVWMLKFAQENQKTIENYLLQFAENYRKTNLADLETTGFEQKIFDYIVSENSLAKVENALFDALNGFLKEDFLLADKLPDSLKKQLVNLLSLFLLNQSENYLKQIGGEDFLNKLNTLGAARFQNFAEKNIIQLLGEAQSEKAQKMFSKFIFKQLQNEENRSKIFGFLESKIAEEIAPEKKIQELFGGKLLALVNTNLDFVIQKILSAALDWLKENSSKMADQVYDEAFREQKAVFIYKDNIKKTVIDLVNNGIPVFLASEKDSLAELLNGEIQRLGEVNLGQIGVDLNKDDLREMFAKLLESNRLLAAIDELSKGLMASFFTLPLNQVLYVAGLQDLKSVLRLFDGEINVFATHLREIFKYKHEELEKWLNEISQNALETLVVKTNFSDLIAETDESQWQSAVHKALFAVVKTDAFEWQAKKLLRGIFEEMKQKPLDELMHWEALKGDLAGALQAIFAHEEVRKSFATALKNLLEKNMVSLNQNIQPETKQFAVDLIVNAAIEVLSEKLPNLLEALDIKKVVIREIEKMPPNEIEGLFNSFAKKYFDELVNYGFGFGIIFGLLADLLMLALTQALDEVM